MNIVLMSAGHHILQLLKIEILETMVDLFIIVTIDNKIQFLITILSISTRIKVIVFNKQVE